MPYSPENALVWGEIPVHDLDKAAAFYSRITGMTITRDDSGPNPMAICQPNNTTTGVSLSLYPGTPATRGSGPTLHLAAQGTLADIMQRVRDAGGEVVSAPIPLPSGQFFYALDPDGNSVGFYERL